MSNVAYAVTLVLSTLDPEIETQSVHSASTKKSKAPTKASSRASSKRSSRVKAKAPAPRQATSFLYNGNVSVISRNNFGVPDSAPTPPHNSSALSSNSEFYLYF